MGRQIHKRLSKEFVEEVLEAFNEKRMAEEMALDLLVVKRTRLYELKKGLATEQDERGKIQVMESHKE